MTAGSQLGHSRHGQRPGTPNPKADFLTAAATASSMGTHPRGPVKIPAAFTKSASSSSQDWPISRWGSSRLLGVSPSAAASNAVPAVHAGQGSGAAELAKVEQTGDESALSRSSSDSSSIAASLRDESHAHKLQAGRSLTSGSSQPIARVRASNVQRPQPASSSLASADAASTSNSSDFNGHAVSGPVLCQALKSLGSKHGRHGSQAELSSRQEGAAGHMNGNTVVSCISSAEMAGAASVVKASKSLNVHSRTDALLRESDEVMHWLGMDHGWFEEDFLPFAKRVVLLGHTYE